MSLSEQPRVSVVTPFYNTEGYIAECIESVIAQTYSNWEYILVNNYSTDRSFEIARSYAEREPRIRLINNDSFLSQVQNYNHALRAICPESKYCKIVQADDWIFPECITEMVRIAEINPTVGVVGSYWLRDNTVYGSGLPYPSTCMTGSEICRWHLLNHPDAYVFGPPTVLMVRSDLLRNRDPFYDESSILEDYDIYYELLVNNDFGFAHQVLSFIRVDNESQTAKIRAFFPYLLHAFICLKKFGQVYLIEEEYNQRLESISKRYFEALAKGFMYERDKEFWTYHKHGLQSIGYKLDRLKMTKYILYELLDLVRHPKALVRRLTEFAR